MCVSLLFAVCRTTCCSLLLAPWQLQITPSLSLLPAVTVAPNRQRPGPLAIGCDTQVAGTTANSLAEVRVSLYLFLSLSLALRQPPGRTIRDQAGPNSLALYCRCLYIYLCAGVIRYVSAVRADNERSCTCCIGLSVCLSVRLYVRVCFHSLRSQYAINSFLIATTRTLASSHTNERYLGRSRL